MKTTETRYLSVQEAELRKAADSVTPRIVGYPIVFDRPSLVISDYGIRFREIIKPSAVEGVLDDGDIRALVNHESRLILGRASKGTLRYVVDGRGVFAQIDPPDTSYARDLLISMDRGDVDGMSFKFAVAPGGEQWSRDGDLRVRTITRFARVPEFSVVTFPAYPDAEAAVRSLKEYEESQLSDVRVDAAAERIQRALDALTAGPRNRRA